MKNYVPNSYFISIDVPTSDELDNWRELLYNRYWTYKTKNILELTGECASRYYQIYPKAKRDEVMSFTAKVLKMKNVTKDNVKNFVSILVYTNPKKITKEEAMEIMNNNDLVTGVYKCLKLMASR